MKDLTPAACLYLSPMVALACSKTPMWTAPPGARTFSPQHRGPPVREPCGVKLRGTAERKLRATEEKNRPPISGAGGAYKRVFELVGVSSYEPSHLFKVGVDDAEHKVKPPQASSATADSACDGHRCLLYGGIHMRVFEHVDLVPLRRVRNASLMNGDHAGFRDIHCHDSTEGLHR